MAILEHETTGAVHPLAARTLVGRSRDCQLRLARTRVSGVHAELIWHGDRWQIHDLGSRNGTLVNGERLAPDEHRRLGEGAWVVFGTHEERFILRDASPPGLVAFADDGTVQSASGGLLCLPSNDAPELTVAERSGVGWEIETGDGQRLLVDRERLIAGGQGWTIHLPGAVQHTDDGSEEPITVARATLGFEVSRDGRHIQIRIWQGPRAIKLRPRVHDAFLLSLARVRVRDQMRPELVESDHGWVHRQELARSLNVDRNLLNLWVHRVRRQFADVGVQNVADLIQRRSGTEHLRLGVYQVEIAGHDQGSNPTEPVPSTPSSEP